MILALLDLGIQRRFQESPTGLYYKKEYMRHSDIKEANIIPDLDKKE